MLEVHIMIKAFGVRNYTCFQDWMELDCTLNDQVPERFHNDNHVAPILCLKGANASGKTNAIKAIVFLTNFIKHSFTNSAETPFTIDTFFNNNMPTEFYIEFITKDKKEYLYELKLDGELVHYEKLTLNKQVVLHRELQELKNVKLFNDIKIPFNSNVSVISAAFYYPETQDAVGSIRSFFDNIFTNVTRFGFTEYPDMLADRFRASLFSKLYKNENEAFIFMQTFLKRFDLGIEKIEIGSQQLPDGKSFYYPVFTHSSSGQSYILLDENESSGTRALFTNLLYYYHTLHYGGLLLLDEFDVNVTFPEEYHAKALAGKPAVFKVVLKEIKRKELPELDDDFVQDVSEYNTVDEYKEALTKRVAERKASTAKNAKEEAAIDKVIEAAKMDIPEAMVESQTRQMAQDFANRIRGQGLSPEQYFQFTGMTPDTFMENLRPQALKRIQSRLVLEAVVKAENIEATEDDFNKELEEMSKAYNMELDKLKESIGEEEKKSMMVDIAVSKAVDFIRDSAVETEEAETPKKTARKPRKKKEETTEE